MIYLVFPQDNNGLEEGTDLIVSFTSGSLNHTAASNLGGIWFA